MTISRSPINSSMQRSNCRSPGWAAFDRKQREKQSTGPEYDVDPFPSITNLISSVPTESSLAKSYAPVKTFSSVIHPSLEFPLLVGNCKSGILNDKSGGKHKANQITPGTHANPVEILKDIHSWADESLIEDILTAVNNDVEQASVVLKAMVSPVSKIDHSGASASAVSYPCVNNCSGESVVVDKLSGGVHEVLISRQLLSVPVEPEWEEDDIYLSHRKDAIKMIRTASQHSRAAGSAFSRGDHVTAHQLSLRAREERMAAEKLNTKAAQEILRLRNNNNDIWKLDLHGLHATEAVSALKEHLSMIESQIPMSHSVSSDGLTKLENGIVRSPSLESIGGLDEDTVTKEKKSIPNQRQTVLHVITGTGNHSRGQAALPTAVRSFLSENRYRFDDARPGVIAVRPKFRHK